MTLTPSGHLASGHPFPLLGSWAPNSPTSSGIHWDCASFVGEPDPGPECQWSCGAWEAWEVISQTLTARAFTKRDRIPLSHQDWLAAVCHWWGMEVVADGLFPRLLPAARRAALVAVLAAEANADVYMVGRDPATGVLQTLPAPATSFSIEPQRFRLYVFASEDPMRLAGAWRSFKVWSLRWQADSFPLGAVPWRSASWPSAHLAAHAALHASASCGQSFTSIGGRS